MGFPWEKRDRYRCGKARQSKDQKICLFVLCSEFSLENEKKDGFNHDNSNSSNLKNRHTTNPTRGNDGAGSNSSNRSNRNSGTAGDKWGLMVVASRASKVHFFYFNSLFFFIKCPLQLDMYTKRKKTHQHHTPTPSRHIAMKATTPSRAGLWWTNKGPYDEECKTAQETSYNVSWALGYFLFFFISSVHFIFS